MGTALGRLVGEFLERLDLRDVTLVGNDWGGAQLVVPEGCDERVGRLVPCACEAFDNYPPGPAPRLFRDPRLVEVQDSSTLIAEDQPDAVIAHLRDFLRLEPGRGQDAGTQECSPWSESGRTHSPTGSMTPSMVACVVAIR